MRIILICFFVLVRSLAALGTTYATATIHNSGSCCAYNVGVAQGYVAGCAAYPSYCCSPGNWATYGTLCSGGTVTSGATDYPVNDGAFCGDYSYYVYYNTNASGAGGLFNGPMVTPSAGGTFNLDVGGACGSAATNCTYVANVSNPTGAAVNGYWKQNGSTVFSTTIPAFGSASHTFTFVCGANSQLDFGYTSGTVAVGTNPDGSPSFSWSGSDGHTDVGANTVTGSGGLNVTNSFVGTNYQASGNSLATNGLINFNSSDTGAARDSTLKAGFNQLAQDDVTLLAATVAKSNTVSVTYSPTNAVNVVFTNNLTAGVGFDGVAMSQLTNSAGQIDKGVTSLSNAVAATNSGLFDLTHPLAMTNGLVLDAATATNQVESDFASQLGSMRSTVADFSNIGTGAVDDMDDVLSTIDVGVVGVPVFNFNLTGRAWAPMWTLLKQVTTWLLCALYLVAVLKGSFEWVANLAQVPGNALPNLNFALPLGAGGNWVGVAVWKLATVVLFVLWGVGLAFLATWLAGVWTSTVGTVLKSNPLSGASVDVLRLLSHAFPISLAIALLSAYVIFLGTRTTIFIVVSASIKKLPA